MTDRRILASRPHIVGKTTAAKLFINRLDGRRTFTDGEAFGADFEARLRECQRAFGLVPSDGKLDQATFDVIAWLVAIDGPDWQRLPLVHPASGAIIPYRFGPTSVEVHLGTLGTGDQLARHRTILPADHPWHPSRYHLASPPSTQWGGGAFGIDPTEEQWYCNQLWPYADGTHLGGPARSGPGKDAYRHRRVLVTNERTGRQCVCVPGEYGPNRASTGHVAGLSPDTMYVTGGRHGDVYYFGWLPDSTPLGPRP